EQAAVVAIGRALAAWKMTADAEGYGQQTARAACFARRLPEVAMVDTDPLGHRLTVQFTSGWRVGVVPVEDGVAPEATPGLSALGPESCP
ncbi:MAG: hypothetical protein HOP28_14165, partial [Gemmatimonadales bacterium]|nr:hypothetical protein [Gemmatimonadales bacterium]